MGATEIFGEKVRGSQGGIKFYMTEIISNNIVKGKVQ